MVSFSQLPLKPNVYSNRPYKFLDADEHKVFSFLMEIILIETGDRAARKNWQSAQLANLFEHASNRSQFWRERFGAKKVSHIKYSRIPKMTRADLNKQVTQEGALLSEKDRIDVAKHTTSGSTGAPVSFFNSDLNAVYNEARNFAQYIIDNRDLRLNRCRLVFNPLRPGYTYGEDSSYAGRFSRLFSTGKNAEIGYLGVDLELIIKKMKAYKPHYLVCLPQFIETMARNVGPDIFREIDVRLFMPYGNTISSEVRKLSTELGVPIQSNYSCEECGLIGYECAENPDYYHVAGSNVIVELGQEQIEDDGVVCKNLLVAALHSYASPIIRYELGDFVSVIDECPCGHQGPTINKLLGRVSTTLKLPDGKRRPFHIAAQLLQGVLAYEDLKIRQTAPHEISVEVVSKEKGESARVRLTEYLQRMCGREFVINIEFCDQIDWGISPKRLAFLCEI